MRAELLRAENMGSRRVNLAVVIDVLRATSTATVLMARGVKELIAVAEADEIPSVLASRAANWLIFSEIREAAQYGNRQDNSPVAANTVNLTNAAPILVTNNGTRLLKLAVANADQVLLGCFLNLRSVVRTILAIAPESVALMPAGHFKTKDKRTEDDACAEAFLSCIQGERWEPELSFARCRHDARIQRRIEREPGFEADVEFSLRSDVYDIVPEVCVSDSVSNPMMRIVAKPEERRG